MAKKEKSIRQRMIDDFEDSVLCPVLSDISIDIADVSYDILGDMIFGAAYSGLKEFPIVKSVIAIGETGWNIHRAHTLKKQLVFIDALTKGNVNPEEVQRRKRALENNEKWVHNEIETTLVYLDRYSHVEKAQIHALLYADLINQKIDFIQYMERLDIIDRMFMSDIMKVYRPLTEGENRDRSQSECDRLQSLGLFHGIITTRVGHSSIDEYTETELGSYIFQLIRKAFQQREEARLSN